MLKWYWTVLIGLVSAYIGYKLNQRANEQSEKRIIDALTTEIESLKNKRVTAEEQARLNGLNEALQLLKNK